MEHVSVIQSGKKLEARSTDGTLFVCPLCPEQQSTTWKKIKEHFEGHMNTALHFKDKIICRCNLPCRASAHYHCPFCGKTIIRKKQMGFHIKFCQPDTAQVTSTEMTSPASTRQLPPHHQGHEYSRLLSTSNRVVPNSADRLPQRPPLLSGPERTPLEDHDYSLPASTPRDSMTGSEEPVSTKALHKKPLKMAHCPHCALALYQKNLATHIQRKHPQEKDKKKQLPGSI